MHAPRQPGGDGVGKRDRTAAGAAERLLLYTVGGERYASPLDDLREVINTPWPRADALIVHDHEIVTCPLGGLLGLPDDALPAPDGSGAESTMRPALVVAARSSDDDDQPERWVGFLADTVHGMLRSDRVLRVPEGVSRLPDGSLFGAIVLEREKTHGASSQKDDGGPELQPDESEGADGADRTSDEDGEKEVDVVLLLDLTRLAGVVSAEGV